jgi:hypothetical protein
MSYKDMIITHFVMLISICVRHSCHIMKGKAPAAIYEQTYGRMTRIPYNPGVVIQINPYGSCGVMKLLCTSNCWIPILRVVEESKYACKGYRRLPRIVIRENPKGTHESTGSGGMSKIDISISQTHKPMPLTKLNTDILLTSGC